MKNAAYFKQIARNALRGNWGVAILTGFIASLLGANIAANSGGNYNSNSDSIQPDYLMDSELLQLIIPIILIICVALLVWAIVVIIIGGAGRLGYAKFNLNLIDQKPVAVSDLFSQFNRLGAGFCMNFLIGLYTTLWSLLFIIPGIVKSYSYAMTPYILAEAPEMTANEAITKSKQIMHGNKWRLFCLNFSFIGWRLLSIVPTLFLLPLALIGTIGSLLWLLLAFVSIFVFNLFLMPYTEAAHAAFYREISSACHSDTDIEFGIVTV